MLQDTFNHIMPAGHVFRFQRHIQFLQHDVIHMLLFQQLRNLVNAFGRQVLDDRFLIHIAEHGQLGNHVFGHGMFAAAHQNIRRNTDAAQFLDTVLGRFRFQFPRRADIGNQRHMDIQHVVFAHIFFYLADSFQERQAFNIANRAPDFSNDKIRAVIVADPEHPGFNLVGNMGDDLHRAAQVITPAFFGNDRLINFTGSHVGTFGQVDINKTFIMAQVQICFRAIIRHEHFTVLIRTHGSRIDIDIRIEFLYRNLIAPALQQTSQRSRRNPLAQRRNHAACYKNVLCCH